MVSRLLGHGQRPPDVLDPSIHPILLQVTSLPSLTIIITTSSRGYCQGRKQAAFTDYLCVSFWARKVW